MDNSTGLQAPARKRPIRGTRSLASEAAFRARLEELGASLLEPEWLGTKRKHHVRCSAGHDCYPMPDSVLGGHGPCRTCVGQDPLAAWNEFRRRVAEAGAELLEAEWLGSGRGHRVRCSEGHECRPMPASLQQGQGVCGVCAGNSREAAEAAFRARLAECGATVLGPYLNNKTKVYVRCAEGHNAYASPAHVAKGGGFCRTCSRKDPVATELAFRSRLAELGATPLYTEYMGALRPHHVRCLNGHDCYSRPADVLQGDGVCHHCWHKAWDAFYVVGNDAERAIKFGITSGDPRPRLAVHRSSGYHTVIRLLVDLPTDIAPDIERLAKSALRIAGETPIRGREYFKMHTLGTVLDIVDNYPIPVARPPHRLDRAMGQPVAE